MRGYVLRGAMAPLLQIALIVGALATLVAWPPASGRILLIPMSARAHASLARVAIAHGARLVATGPVPLSLVVEGQRAALAGPLLASGVMLLAAPNVGCTPLEARA